MNKKINILTIIISSVFIISACSSAEVVSQVVEKNQTRVEVEAVMVKEVIDTTPGIGSFEASTKLEVLANGSGDIKDLKVKAGDKVKKGNLLFALDNESALINYNLQESQLRTLRDNLKTQYDDLKVSYSQKEALFNSGSISKSELDSSKSQLSQIENQYNDAINNYNNQKRNLSNSINDRNIKSPIDGVVAIVYIKENESVNNKVALEIINDENIIFKTMVTGETLDNISIGTKTSLYLDGDKTISMSGEVIKYNEISDANSGLYEVVVLVNKNDKKIRSGSYGEIDFIKSTKNSLIIKKKALLIEDDNKYVYVVTDGVAKKTLVETGITVDENIEILKGLDEGMQVVTIGQSYLEDMEKVIVVE